MRLVIVTNPHQRLAININVRAAIHGSGWRKMASMTGTDISATVGWGQK